MPLSVSIAMTSYNGARFIQAQLDSIAAQTLKPFELVIGDDGSTDNTHAIINEFARSAPFPVQLRINPERLGFRENFLFTASRCAGNLIAFCDQDDVWLPHKLQRCAEAFSHDDVLLCIHSGRVWHGGDEFVRQILPNIKSDRHYKPLTLDPLAIHPGFALVFRRRLLAITPLETRPGEINFPYGRSPRMSHDMWVWFLASIFGRIAQIQEPLSWYRQHDGNLYGAMEVPGRYGRVLNELKQHHYIAKNRHFLDYAQYLERIAPCIAPPLQPMAQIAAARFRQRVSLRTLRQMIYETPSSTLQKLICVWKIFIQGGYLPGADGTRFGPLAAAKDLTLGITGLYKRWPG